MLNGLKKVLKWFGIVLGSLIILLIIAAIALPYFLPLDKIKDMAAQKASEAIHRNVKIGKVSFNVFTGIELKDLSVSNRPGFSAAPFVSAGRIELKYDLWKLLGGTVAIDKVVLVNPEILVEMRADGTSNYGDLVGAKKPAAPKAAAKPSKKKEAVSIMVSKFSIVNGKLTLNQAGKVSQLKDLNVNISGISLVTKKPIRLYVSVLGLYEGKPVPISVNGDITLDMNKSYAKASGFDITAAGEKLSFNAEVSEFDKAPKIKLNVSSKKIDTDKFLAIVSGTGTKKPKGKPAPYGQLTANINKSLKSIPSNIRLDANIAINNILFKEMKLDSLALKGIMLNKGLTVVLQELKAYGGTVKGDAAVDLKVSGMGYSINAVAKGFDATPASNDVIESFLTKLPDYNDLKNKLHGTLGFNLTLTGRGIETPDIIANAKGKGSFLLANGKVSKLKTLSAIGEKIGLKTLQEDIDIKEFKSNFSIANKVVTLSKLDLNNGDKGDIKLAFDGSANIASLEFIKGNQLSLKLNPATNKISSEYDAFKDEKGWYSLDFEMTGSLKKPIPIPKLGKPVERIIENKKKEVEKAAQKEIDRQKQEAEQKAKEELDKKAKELFKF
jgi:uncharacterized protein involved in outer membrane biogenesis